MASSFDSSSVESCLFGNVVSDTRSGTLGVVLDCEITTLVSVSPSWILKDFEQGEVSWVRMVCCGVGESSATCGGRVWLRRRAAVVESVGLVQSPISRDVGISRDIPAYLVCWEGSWEEALP